MITIWVCFIMQVQKFGGPPPKKLGAKNVQNSARFQTTFECDREYLRNGLGYPKSENVLFNSDSSRVLQRKSGELWSTNYREVDVSLVQPTLNLLADYISALRGCWPLKFSHALEIDQGLLAHTHKGDRAPQKTLRANM